MDYSNLGIETKKNIMHLMALSCPKAWHDNTWGMVYSEKRQVKAAAWEANDLLKVQHLYDW